jgi:hypothetical protein
MEIRNKIFFVMFIMMFSCQKNKENVKENVRKELKKEVTFNLDSQKLLDEYVENSSKVLDMYKGKKIIVSGIIDKIGQNNFKQNYIEFRGTDNIQSLRCYFTDTLLLDKTKLYKLKKGDKTEILGKFVGPQIMAGIYFNKCKINN